jgi:DNA mismatch repair ATPase MutS
MDEKERRPDHEDYDPTTLHIPSAEWNKFTPGMTRYWNIKHKNYDKIVLYRFGQWFIVYYQDAALCNTMIDLCIPPRQVHLIVGFHSSHLEDNIEILVNAGHKVAVCEQTENGAQMEIRLKKEKNVEGADQIKAVKREVSQIFTKGTHFKLDFD